MIGNFKLQFYCGQIRRTGGNRCLDKDKNNDDAVVVVDDDDDDGGGGGGSGGGDFDTNNYIDNFHDVNDIACRFQYIPQMGPGPGPQYGGFNIGNPAMGMSTTARPQGNEGKKGG